MEKKTNMVSDLIEIVSSLHFSKTFSAYAEIFCTPVDLKRCKFSESVSSLRSVFVISGNAKITTLKLKKFLLKMIEILIVF